MVHVAKEMDRLKFDVPLLIGGATTSNKHTAVKIAPAYSHETIHVRDASLAPPVISALRDPEKRKAYQEKNVAEQESLRDAFKQGRIKPLETISDARDRRFHPEWRTEDIATPTTLGARTVEGISLSLLRDYIDWTPFFHAWEL